MKKVIAILSMLAMTAALVSCGGKPGNDPTDNAENQEAPLVGSVFGETENNEPAAPASAGQLDFSTTDIDGNPFSVDDLKDAKVVMINFWEPWCGPCVGEMPELEQLYRDRNGELLILGVYWTEDGAAEVLSQTGISYPVILFDEVFERFQSGYVPTTIFVDSAGHVIGSPYIGSRSYADWDQIIKGMIGH